MLTTFLVLAVGLMQQGWFTFEPEAKNFRVQLPSKPNKTSTRSVTNSAGKAQITVAQLKTGDALYSVQATETSTKVDPRTLDDGIQRFASANQGMLGAVKTISVDGNPGREFEMTDTLEGAQKRSKIRWVTAGNSLFVLTVAGNSGARLPPNADRFLGSLEIGEAKVAAKSRPKIEDPDEVGTTAKDDDNQGDQTKPASKTPPPKPAARPSTASPKVTISRIPRGAKPYPAQDLADVSRSYAGRDRDGFRDVGPEGSVLVGVQVTYIERFGGPKVRSVQPVYRSNKAHYLGLAYGEIVGPVTSVVAKQGYAVGGLVTHTGLTVDGFRMVFMKVDGDRLDPNDSYESPWIGDAEGGSPGQVFSNGALVVGLQGRASKEVNALGLTVLK